MGAPSPPTKEAILAEILAHLEENLPSRKVPLGAETRLGRDLRLDSVETMGLLARIEDALDVTLPVEVFDGAKTLGDVAERIAALAAAAKAD